MRDGVAVDGEEPADEPARVLEVVVERKLRPLDDVRFGMRVLMAAMVVASRVAPTNVRARLSPFPS